MAVPNSDSPPAAPPLWQDVPPVSPPTTPGTNSTIGSLQVGRSGESIYFRPADGQGNSLPITGLRNTDDTQVLTLVGSPAAATLTLTLGNQTTAPIPLQPGPPLTSFVWSATLPAAGTYDLAISYSFDSTPPTGRACTQTLIEVLDGTTIVGTATLDQSHYPDPSVDLVISHVGVFKAIGSFTLQSPNLTVRMSGDAGNGPVLTGLIRIAPHGSTDPNLVGFLDPTPAGSPYNGNLAGQVTVQRFGSWTANWTIIAGSYHGFYYALPTGTRPTAQPAVADLQKALQALSTVPLGAVAVVAATNQSFLVQFSGLLGGRAMPTLITSDSAFRVTHDDTGGSSVGGQFPTATINGTPHLLQAASFAPGEPVVAFHLVQDTPALQYLSAGQAMFTLQNYPPVTYGIGYSGRVAFSSGAGTVATCQLQGLSGPADYEVALTWPGGIATADLLSCSVQDGQGTTLATMTGLNQTQAPTGFQDAGVGWITVARCHLPAQVNKLSVVLTAAGTAGKNCLIDALRLVRTSPDQGTRIKPGDTVLFSAPSGFISTSQGPMPAVQSLRVLPAPAQRMPPLPPKLRTMKLGFNCSPPVYYGTDSVYSNYAIMALTPLGLAPGPDGNPTQLAPDPYLPGRGRATILLSTPASDEGGAGYGAPNCSPGTWVVQWTSQIGVECALIPHDNTTIIAEDQSRRVVGTTNRRYFTITVQGATAPALLLQVLSNQAGPNGNYRCDLGSLAIYPPDVNPDQPGYWRPTFLQKLAGMHCFRFMDFFSTNNLNLASFDHFPDQAKFPLGYSNRTLTAPILSIGPPQPDLFCDNIPGTVVRVTTKGPHGLTTGFTVGLRTTDGTSLGLVQGNVVDPKTGQTTSTPRDAIDPTDGYNGRSLRGFCHVLDATTFQLDLTVYYGPFARMTNTLTPTNGMIIADLSPGTVITPSDAARLCADAQLEPWVNVPWLADDDCVTRLAQAFVAQTPPGVAVHVEYGNEPWNYYFPGFHYLARLNLLNGGTGYTSVPAYIARMGQVHQIFRNVWAQAGRNVAEVHRVCGAQQAYTGGSTIPMIAQALALGIAFDELTVASYFSNVPLQGNYDDLLTREQLLDLLAVNVQLGVTAAQITAHQQAIQQAAAANPQAGWLNQVSIVNYEGGPDIMTTASMTANLAQLNHGVHRDPDFLEIMLYWLSLLEDSGVRLFNIFTMYGIGQVDQWGVYEGFQTQPGTGIAALDLANRNDTENLLAVKSETAGALRQWLALRIPARPTTQVVRAGLSAVGRSTWANTAPAA